MQGKENRFLHNFEQINEVIREFFLNGSKWEIRLESFKLFDLKTVNMF